MKLKTATAMALGMAMIGGGLMADSAAAPAWYANTTVKGYVDASYEYDFNGEAPAYRVFDTTNQGFALNAAQVSIANVDAASGTSGQIDLLYGPNAAVYSGVALTNSNLAIEQAFVTQAFGPVSFKLGRYNSFVGLESANTPGNYNYSRSFLFELEPLFNQGLSATWTVMSGLSLMGYIGDGENATVGTPTHPDFGAQVSYTGVKNLGLTGTYYLNPNSPNSVGGQTPTGNGIGNGGALFGSGLFNGTNLWTNTDTFNFVGTYQIMDNLAAAGEYLYNFEGQPAAYTGDLASLNNQGYAVYLDYKTPIANLSIDPRYEQSFTEYQAQRDQLNDFTLTVKYAMGPLTHYLEYRDDASPATVFTVLTSKPTTTNNTLTYAAVYSF